MPLIGRMEIKLLFNASILTLAAVNWACFQLKEVWGGYCPWVLDRLSPAELVGII